MRVLVTGASGFVGGRLCQALVAHGHQVIAVSRSLPRDLSSEVQWQSLDLSRDLDPTAQALLVGVEAVFHVAAKVDMWGAYQDFFNTNVLGTKRLLDAARAAGVKYFIYTSSPSVIASGSDLISVNESMPYPEHYTAYYPATKAQAEREVLHSNNDSFKTVALRPHLIFGPDDQNLVPTVLERADIGKLIQIGEGRNLSDFTYIDDCISAHLCALETLQDSERSVQAAGRAYFISQSEPWPLWKWVNTLLTLTNRRPISKKIPFWLAHLAALLLENFHRIFRPNVEPLLTRFLVEEMATNHYFDITAARQLLGYEPKFSMQAALEKTAKAFQRK